MGRTLQIILWIMHYIPGLRLRCSEETEIVGIDDAEMGEVRRLPPFLSY